MINKNDWRLQGQEKYLKGAILNFKKYAKYSQNWDHDHCEFCWTKLTLDGLQDALDEGYASGVFATSKIFSNGLYCSCLNNPHK